MSNSNSYLEKKIKKKKRSNPVLKAITNLSVSLNLKINTLQHQFSIEVSAIKEEVSSIKEEVSSIKEEVSAIKAEVSAIKVEVSAVVETLTHGLPKAVLQLLKPQIVTQLTAKELKEGATSTWTYLKDDQSKFYAIGSAHCGFYHRGRLITLPKDICECGVIAVHFSAQLCKDKDFWRTCHDVVVVELNQAPTYNSKVIWQKNLYKKPLNGSSTCGISSSGYVLGEPLVYDPIEKVYFFNETTGEAGHSGTLMFAPIDGVLQPYGVYFGTSQPTPKLQVRAIVVPLIFSQLEKRDLIDPPPKKVTVMGYMHGQMVQTQLELTKITAPNGCDYISYRQNGGETHYGVVVRGLDVLLCGGLVTGSLYPDI
eukprot:TRINITY_DN1260_c0_g1_i2.p1 TRINITY_DN1260_c0_g1~~TRINITY_DN1260_c0_g1_i2.p1  ORF type:complete len:368 (+),score=57.63 TRINITY_DN1260_c0_g1_i2:65-1168(+)